VWSWFWNNEHNYPWILQQKVLLPINYVNKKIWCLISSIFNFTNCQFSDHVYIRHLLTEYRSTLSANMLTDSWPMYRPILGQYVGRHIGWISVDTLFELIHRWSALGWHLGRYVAIECWWCIGGFLVVWPWVYCLCQEELWNITGSRDRKPIHVAGRGHSRTNK